MVPGQLTPHPHPDDTPPPLTGACQCGTPASGPRWCGLAHHGLGCHHRGPLTPMPRTPHNLLTLHVCTRCAHRATWWHTRPDDRAPLHDAGILGGVIIGPDDTRIPVGRRPPYLRR
ncbi:hypothetical protein [Streptomyces noursei]